MTDPFPVVSPCHPLCTARLNAMKAGEFMPLFGTGGWTFTHGKGVAVVWFDCPYCGGKLKNPDEIARDILGEPDGDDDDAA